MNLNLRLTVRRWLGYFLPWSLLVILLAAYFYRAETQHERQRIQALDAVNTRLGAESLNASARQLGRDLFTLAGYVDLSEALEREDPASIARLTEEYLNFARTRRIYDQVRWIDESGRERIRIEATVRGATIVQTRERLDQTDQSFFSATMGLKPGELHVSALDLDVDNGRIETPVKPVVRVATPLVDSGGRARGILILNYLGEEMLERFRMAMEQIESRSMLLNAEGFWLVSGRKEDEWGFMYGRQDSLATRHPAAWATIRAGTGGQFEDEAGVWTYETIHPVLESGKSGHPAPAGFVPSRNADEERRYQWKVVTLLPADELHALYTRLLPQTLAVTVAALLIMLFGSWRLAAARTRQIEAEAALRRSNVDLERMVDARTQQLSAEVAERQLAEHRYRESSEQYQRILATMHDAYWLNDDTGAVLDVNAATCEMLGYSRNELLTMNVADIDASRSPVGVAANIEAIGAAGYDRFESRHRRKDGSVIDVEVSLSFLPEYRRYVALVRDISERKRLEAERRLASLVLANTDEGVLVCAADLKIRSVNPAFSRITGYPAEAVIGRSPAMLNVRPEGKTLRAFLAELMPRLHADGSWHGELRSRRKSGELFPVWLNISIVRDAQPEAELYVAVFSDITMIKESQARLNYLAHHDALTDLPNRLLFQARLEHSLERARRDDRSVAVLFIDLDHFKEVNDTLGHAVGDQLLRDIAAAMGGCLRGEDTLARLGGDEFIILLEDVGGVAGVESVIDKLEKVFPWQVPAGERSIAVTASIGVSLFPADGRDVETLVMRADAAMYEAKASGRACHCFAGPATDQPASTAP